MFDKQFVESFLKLNNASTDLPDEDVRKILRNAKWKEEEITAAIKLLRDKDSSGVVAVSKGNASVFRPEFDFSSKELSVLLGVDVVIDPSSVAESQLPIGIKIRRGMEEAFTGFAMFALSIIVAISLGIAIAYVMQVGPFYSPV